MRGLPVSARSRGRPPVIRKVAALNLRLINLAVTGKIRTRGCRSPGIPYKRHRPELDRAIEAGRGDPLAVGAEGHALHPANVATQALDPLGHCIPDPDGRIGTSPGEQSAIG